MSNVTCHVSSVKCHIFFNGTKWWTKSGEGLLSTGPTPSSSLTERVVFGADLGNANNIFQKPYNYTTPFSKSSRQQGAGSRDQGAACLKTRFIALV